LFRILEQTHADVVCLQEVTPQFLGWLREQSWVRSGYVLSDSVGSTLRGTELVYGVLMLLRKDLPILSVRLHTLPTTMNRAVLVSTLQDGSEHLQIATVHLESLDNKAVRVAQLEQISKVLSSNAGNEQDVDLSSRPRMCILAGDMNFDSGSHEDSVVERYEFIDCWKALESLPKAEEDACDVDNGATMPFDDHLGVPTRIDRIFLGPAQGTSCWQLLPGSICRLGMEPIDNVHSTDADVPGLSGSSVNMSAVIDTDTDTDPEMPELIPVRSRKPMRELSDFPSDHYGLLCDFQVCGTDVSQVV
jgi:endonuclease/exonuclease/phosphatase family metal-dependent hydrolase